MPYKPYHPCIVQADVSIMVEKRLTLLLDDDMDEVAIAERKLRAFLPDINVDKCVGWGENRVAWRHSTAQ